MTAPGPREVHVWSVPLAVPAGELARLHALLDAEERRRAARYLAPAPREQFTVTRGRLREVLGRYLGVDPREVAFTASATGKPALAGGGLTFNVSHTHGLALVAVAAAAEVGVDVEQVREQANYLELAERYFTPAEAGRLRALPPAEGVRAFFHVWTRKEAFLKATGLGLSYGLERFEVSVPPDEPCRIVRIDGSAEVAAGWTLANLTPGPGHVGALAVEGAGWAVVARGV